MPEARRVAYVHERPGVHAGNILWDGSWEMRAGRFPVGHPCAVGTGSPAASFDQGRGPQFGSGPELDAFRARGYWASCFPEGDGITMECCNGQSADQVMADIRECFGWTVTKEGRDG